MKKLIKVLGLFLISVIKLNLYWNIISYFFLIPLFTLPLYVVEYYCNEIGLIFSQTLFFAVIKYFLWFFSLVDKLTEIPVLFEPFVFESEFYLLQVVEPEVIDNTVSFEVLDDSLVNDDVTIITDCVVVDFFELADLKMYKLSGTQVINSNQNFNIFGVINL